MIDVSDTHGFWLDNNEQVFVKNLVEGESKIYIKDSSDISLELVTQVELIETEEEVFTFRIPNYENYISNGIISHNPVGGYPNTEQVYMSQPQTRSGIYDSCPILLHIIQELNVLTHSLHLVMILKIV